MRQAWGEKQGEVHPGGQELFLDLIFVGVAFRVGQVLKSCIYACDPPTTGYYNYYGAGNQSSSSYSSGRALAPSSSTADPCLDLGLSILHTLAPFVCMYTLWDLEKRMRSQYTINSKVRAVVRRAARCAIWTIWGGEAPAAQLPGIARCFCSEPALLCTGVGACV